MSKFSYTRNQSVDQSAAAYPALTVDSRVSELKSVVFDHPSIAILNRFEENLHSRPLTNGEMRILLASEGTFVLEVPPAIVNLSSRITDERFKTDPFGSTGMAARILYAAVDEYGLNQMESIGLLPSHHQLYLDMAAHWGMSAEDLIKDEYIVSEAKKFSKTISVFYRKKPIIQSLGFHVANETTAPLDFGVFLRVFQKYRREYNIAPNDPMLNFLMIHEDVEESHREMGVEMVQMYADGKDDLIEESKVGVYAYMDAYGRFFDQLNSTIFHG